jgi:hypothetical protein
MTCDIRAILVIFGLHLLPLVLVGCSDTISVTVIGVSMRANDGCEVVEHEYDVEISAHEAEPKAIPFEFCGSLPDRPDEITCFRIAENGTRWSSMSKASEMAREDPPHDHPDVLCWEDDLFRWYWESGLGEDIEGRDDEHLDPTLWQEDASHPMWSPTGPYY